MTSDHALIEPGILRALRAEARQTERSRVLETLESAMLAAEQRANASDSTRPASTSDGRTASAMAAAIELLAAEPHGWFASNAGEPYACTANAFDAVEVYEYDPPEEPDDLPVRIVVFDGADSMKASAYLTLDDAQEVANELDALVSKLRVARAARAADSGSRADVAEEASADA